MAASSKFLDALREISALPDYWKAARQTPLSPARESKHAYGAHRRQYILKRRPTKVSSDLLVVFIHGGGWQFGRPEHYRHHAMFFNDLGFEVWMPSIRRLPTHHLGHMREDLGHIMTLITAEPYRHVLWAGVSSGGHLASLAVCDPLLHRHVGFDARHNTGLLLIGAPLFVSRLPWMSPKLGLTRSKTALARLLDPAMLISPTPHLPILGLYGRRDGLVPEEAGLKPLQGTGRHIQYHCWPELGHIDLAGWAIDLPEARTLVQNWLRDMGWLPNAH